MHWAPDRGTSLHSMQNQQESDRCLYGEANLYNEHLRISPSHFASNGSQAVTLTCTYTGGNPRPDHYEWSITACRERSSGNICTFTPDPTAEELKTVTCTALRRSLRSLKTTVENDCTFEILCLVCLSDPPPDKPVIQSQNSGREYLQPGDVVTCTVSGGSPPVESVHLSCLDPSLPDQHDQRYATAVASSVTITNAVQDDDDVEMTCFCNATWSLKPQYYQLTSTAMYNVGRAPRKLFNETLTMTGDGIVFTLQAYPVPDLFAFTHLGDSRSGPGKVMNPTLFSSKCRQNTEMEYTVSCTIVPSSLSEKHLGFYRTTVSNAQGYVDVTFQAHQEDRAVVERLTVNGMEETVTLNRDDQVTLACWASGRPVPSVSITRGYTVFTGSDVHYDRTGSTSSQAVLTLSAAHCDDMGTYTCTVTNGIAGSDTKTIRLNTNCKCFACHFSVGLLLCFQMVLV
ncbi:uncharacterized protein [Littorina saxatilis]|uniref:uncharacterized protein n=1 Tax=Littorina saxatilis TaxID=31220 RepID=UPI0038B5E23A